jgi:hypothetical protein
MKAIARHNDVDLPLILTEGLRWITSKNDEWVGLDCEVRSPLTQETSRKVIAEGLLCKIIVLLE